MTYTYNVYSYDGGFDVELSDYPNKTTHCLHVIYSVYVDTTEEVDTTYTTDTFVSPDDVTVVDGVVCIQGHNVYNM